MFSKALPVFLTLVLINSLSIAQRNEFDNNFQVKNPGKKFDKKCGELLSILSNKPKEVGLGNYLNEINEISISFNDYEWYQNLITDKKDGLSIDIITRHQMPCGKPNLLKNGYSNLGYLMRPLYKDELEEKSYTYDNNIVIEFGELPARYDRGNIELAIVFIKDGYACHNQTFRSLERYRWNILEMGLFLDTLTESSIIDQSISLDKRLKFAIPFEKDQSIFNQKDIQPLYDSLNLTDFNIKNISIIAYTSIEGSRAHNIELQNQRAESIVNALQSYQSSKIERHIDARENWVEFFEDISRTGYKSFTSYSKNEIKEKLQSKLLLQELEPILSKHRKAIIEIELEKKYSYQDKGKNELVNLFQQQVKNNNLKQAKEIQKVIFSKVNSREISVDLNGEIDIPGTAYFGLLKNNHIAFSYFNEQTDLYTALAAYEDLLSIIPDSYQVRYNLITLKLKSWIMSDIGINDKEIYDEIIGLKKYGIDQQLIDRLLINYHIILSEYMMQARKFADKDWSIREIGKLYNDHDFSDEDLLRLAQYFSYYSHYAWAKRVIQPRIFDLDTNEDLLFYYISLTINEYQKIGEENYRKLLLNAVNINQDRFCQLFNPSHDGGLSMMYLAYDYFKDQFCENCQ